jgi:hypothetical protein
LKFIFMNPPMRLFGRTNFAIPSAELARRLPSCNNGGFAMNTKSITDKEERKKVKREARKKAEVAKPKAKRATGVARGSQKAKVKKVAKGQRKR